MSKIQDHPNSLLLVEGNDDFHVIHSLCKQFNISVRNLENPKGGNFSVKDCKGVTELLEQIPVLFKSSNQLTSVGVIIDADIDLQSRWESVKNILLKEGFDLPKDLPENGLIIKKGILKAGVWIMPNNNLNGMLEDFISFLVPQDDKLLPIIKTTLEGLEANNLNKYSLTHKSKALIHSWLSIQEEPGTPLGQGITKRYLSTDEETCKHLVNWINELFCE
jgi:hypothetical protein